MTRSHTGKLAAFAAVMIVLCGCGEEPTRRRSTRPSTRLVTSKPQSAAAPSAAAGRPGVLAGRVVFRGEAPPPRKIQVTKDVQHCGRAGGEVQDVRVSPQGGLADVMIEFRGIKTPEGGWPWKHPQEGYVIRQQGCRFHPRLMVVPDGAELAVHNDDPVAHNINTGQWNDVQTAGAKPVRRKVTSSSPRFMRVSCNIHSWMESWIYVTKSPYHARTAADGAYRIDHVPPGEYRVIASHPTLGVKRLKVKIGDGEAVERTIVYGQ